MALDAVPIGTTGEFLEGGLAVRDFRRCDPELVEPGDLVVDLLEGRLRRLALFLQRLGFLLQNPGEPG
ncbi:MAG TPA: hypothetical protein VEG66_07320 [Thermoplasmata archaeon]|nr:hypothetical protein [Thermoplasmata archaeon]